MQPEKYSVEHIFHFQKEQHPRQQQQQQQPREDEPASARCCGYCCWCDGHQDEIQNYRFNIFTNAF